MGNAIKFTEGIVWVIYWASMFYCWLNLAYECLGMVSNITFAEEEIEGGNYLNHPVVSLRLAKAQEEGCRLIGWLAS